MSKHREIIARTSNVSVQETGATLLHETSLSIPEGFTLIMGPSGSGKSTLLNTLHGIRRPSSGTVEHFDTRGNVAYINKAAEPQTMLARLANKLYRNNQLDQAASAYRARHLGYVAQYPHILNNLTANQYINWTHQAVGNDVDGERLETIVDTLGMAGGLDKYAANLSGGQRQRVALAFSLAHNPSILFADEPTASLDGPNKKKAMDLMRAHADNGNSVICVTHEQSHVQYADTIIHVDNGHATLG